MAKTQYMGQVKLISTPDTKGNVGGWYVVQANDGARYHVSALGGRPARGYPAGTKLALYKTISKFAEIYQLDRI